MKRPNQNPTEENILASLEDDRFKRKDQLYDFLERLSQIEDGFTIAIDADWGSGKTFFVKQLKMLIDLCNGTRDPSVELCNTNLKKLVPSQDWLQLIKEQRAFYYNAWENDTSNSPLASLVLRISQENNRECPPNHFNPANVLKASLNMLTGRDVSGFIESLSNTNTGLLNELSDLDLQNELVKMIDNLLAENYNRLIFFIDELDRCNPAFAVRLLETIKHYFYDERITFVFSVNLNQLKHTINKYYGDGFNSIRYFDKFFDYVYHLPKANTSSVLLSFKERYLLTMGDNYRTAIKYYDFSVRELLKYNNYFSTFLKKIPEDFFYTSKNSVPILKYVLRLWSPIIIGLKIKDYSKYTEFINGKLPDFLIEISNDFFLYGEDFYPILMEVEASLGIEEANKRLRYIYTSLFSNQSINVSSTSLGYLSDLNWDSPSIVKQDLFKFLEI